MSVGAHALRLALFLPHPLLTSVRAPRGDRFLGRWSHAKTRRREGTLNEGHKKYDGYGNRGSKSDTSSGNFASYSLLFAPSRLRVRLHFFAFDCIPMGGMYRETRWRFTPDEAVSTHFARQLTSGAGAAIDRSPAEPAAATSRQAQEPEKFQ